MPTMLCIHTCRSKAKCMISKVQLQNRTLKILFNRDFYEPANMLRSELCTLKVSDICSKNTLLFAHNQQQGTLPDICNYYYMLNNNNVL